MPACLHEGTSVGSVIVFPIVLTHAGMDIGTASVAPGDHCVTSLFDIALVFNIDPGQEYPAVVEFAPFQKISKKKLKKKDAKAGSIEEGTRLL